MTVICDRVRVLFEADERCASTPGSEAHPIHEEEEQEPRASLRVIPLVAESAEEPQYRLLGPETTGLVDVEEIEGGTVPHLRIHNRLDEKLLIIDSQSIIGLKQNRSFNTDLLIGAGETVIAPVSCVEAGRWGRSLGAAVYGDLVPQAVRARKLRSVSRSLAARANYCSDQQEVWSEVERCLNRSGTQSASSAMHDLYEQRRRRLDEAREALDLPEDAVGAAVYIGSRFVGLDLFDRASTMRESWTGVVDSYLLDWMMTGASERGGPDDGTEMEIADVLVVAHERRTQDHAGRLPGEGVLSMSKVRYTEQFKRDAVRLVTEEGYSNKAAAEAVGVCHTTIKAWVDRYRDESPRRTRFASAQDELEHLRAENARLRMEREILKKATAFFARDQTS